MPTIINDLDYDVEDLTMEDFPDESPETARYVISQVGLNKTGAFPEYAAVYAPTA